MRMMALSNAAKSSSTSSCHWRRFSSFVCWSFSSAAAASSAAGPSGGGVGGSVGGNRIKEFLGSVRRFVMRLNGFSSTFKRRDLWRVSGSYELRLMIRDGSDFYLLQPGQGGRRKPSLRKVRCSCANSKVQLLLYTRYDIVLKSIQIRMIVSDQSFGESIISYRPYEAATVLIYKSRGIAANFRPLIKIKYISTPPHCLGSAEAWHDPHSLGG